MSFQESTIGNIPDTLPAFTDVVLLETEFDPGAGAQGYKASALQMFDYITAKYVAAGGAPSTLQQSYTQQSNGIINLIVDKPFSLNSTVAGFLAPRMTDAEFDAIALPDTGLTAFSTTSDRFRVNTGVPATPAYEEIAYLSDVPLEGLQEAYNVENTIQLTNVSPFLINDSLGTNFFKVESSPPLNNFVEFICDVLVKNNILEVKTTDGSPPQMYFVRDLAGVNGDVISRIRLFPNDDLDASRNFNVFESSVTDATAATYSTNTTLRSFSNGLVADMFVSNGLDKSTKVPNGTSGIPEQVLTESDLDLIPAAHSEMYISAPAETVIATQGVAVKVAGTYTGVQLLNFTQLNGRLTYTGTAPVDVKITFSGSSTFDLATGTVALLIYKNNVLIDSSPMDSSLDSTSPAPKNALSQATENLVENDYIEVFVRNNTGTENPTFTTLNCIVTTIDPSQGAPGTTDTLQEVYDESLTGNTILASDKHIEWTSTVAGVKAPSQTSAEFDAINDNPNGLHAWNSFVNRPMWNKGTSSVHDIALGAYLSDIPVVQSGNTGLSIAGTSNIAGLSIVSQEFMRIDNRVNYFVKLSGTPQSKFYFFTLNVPFKTNNFSAISQVSGVSNTALSTQNNYIIDESGSTVVGVCTVPRTSYLLNVWEDIMQTFQGTNTFPANSLQVGDSIIYEVSGQTVGLFTGGEGRLRVVFGGVVIATSSIMIRTNNSLKTWNLKVTITVESPTTYRVAAIGQYTGQGGATLRPIENLEIGGQPLAFSTLVANQIKVEFESTQQNNGFFFIADTALIKRVPGSLSFIPSNSTDIQANVGTKTILSDYSTTQFNIDKQTDIRLSFTYEV